MLSAKFAEKDIKIMKILYQFHAHLLNEHPEKLRKNVHVFYFTFYEKNSNIRWKHILIKKNHLLKLI